MIRKEGGRRPLLVAGTHRQMLHGIKDNLSHVHQRDNGQPETPEGSANGSAASSLQAEAAATMHLKNELSSVSGVLDKPLIGATSSVGANKGMDRLGYNQKAMAEIRQSLAEYQINEVPHSSINLSNGFDDPIPNKHMLQQLKGMGMEEETAKNALKLTGNKSVDAALEIFHKLNPHEGKNGFSKLSSTNLAAYGSKVIRKPSFEDKYKYGRGSPVGSENSSGRSDSPGMGPQRQYHIEQHQRIMHNTTVTNSGGVTVTNSSLAITNTNSTTLAVPSGMGVGPGGVGVGMVGPGGQCVVVNDRHTPSPPSIPPRGTKPGAPSRRPTPPPPPHPDQPQINTAQEQTYREQTPAMLPNSQPPGHVQHMIKIMSPSGAGGAHETGVAVLWPPQSQAPSVTPPRGASPIQSRTPVIMQQPGLAPTAQYATVPPSNLLPAKPSIQGRPLPPVPSDCDASSQGSPLSSAAGSPALYRQPPPYTASPLLPNKPSPTMPHSSQHPHEFTGLDMYTLMSPQLTSGSGSPLSSHSPSPGPTLAGTPGQSPCGTPTTNKHAPLQPAQMWGAKQPRIVMQQVKSRQVQKPVLQTATAPLSPPHIGGGGDQTPPQQHQPQMALGVNHQGMALGPHHNYVSSVQAQVNQPPMNPSPLPLHTQHPANMHIQYRDVDIEITHHAAQRAPPHHPAHMDYGPQRQHHFYHGTQPNEWLVQIQTQGGMVINKPGFSHQDYIYTQSGMHPGFRHDTPSSGRSESPVPRAFNQSPMSVISTISSTPSTNSDLPPDKPPPPYPGLGKVMNITLPNPNTVAQLPHNLFANFPDDLSSTDSDKLTDCKTDFESSEKDSCASSVKSDQKEETNSEKERRLTVRNYSPQAYKFYMEQHMENIQKYKLDRQQRKTQLEEEMEKVGLSEEAQTQMRKMLSQKESNYIRLKRAKMEKAMFEVVKPLGIGAFGEVSMVRKKDTDQLYAMKTLRKRDVLQRNQAAHVKAERDILAEADNEWVVKLYYSFQDKENLYFVMDYIPGGDMMSLLIKFGIFDMTLAVFYVAELVLAIESVHKMGFIHRDIKPDNILIDRDGHIKLTDFGLCTGFRWTHNSKYYQKSNHARQDSMEADESWARNCHCNPKEILKPLERRKLRHQRCMAHSLVGTPNYIAPEVLLRSGYSSCCDWWSVGVILYEMLVGQPPFLANSPAETQFKVIHWDKNLHIPPESSLSKESIDLILKLCQGPEKRLGHNGADEVKEHPFFSEVTFEILRNQPAPHQPKIKYPTDTSNFDPVDSDKQHSSGSDMDSVKKHNTLENGKQPEHAFFEFTFRRFFDEGGNMKMQKLPPDPGDILEDLVEEEDQGGEGDIDDTSSEHSMAAKDAVYV